MRKCRSGLCPREQSLTGTAVIRILETLLTNAVTVALLAAVVWAACRVIRRPAIAHGLWVLLLVKLLTPSFIQIPLPFETTVPQVVSKVLRDVAPNDPATPTHVSEATRAEATETVTSSKDSIPALSTITAAMAKRSLMENVVCIFLYTWLIGTITYLARMVYQQVRFTLFLRANEEIDVDLIGEGYNLAWQMGLDNPPKVRILRGALSPMLCGIGRGLTLILPAELSDRLSQESRATLIVHELGHYLRRDHWVRILEGIATSVFWWHPIVWFIRRQIEVVEEECVDARVVAEFPDRPRQYAEALLDTLDFLCERRVILPPMASGLGSAPLLRRRLKQIMSDEPTAEKTIGRKGAAALAIVTACTLPLQAVHFHKAVTEGSFGALANPFGSAPNEVLNSVDRSPLNGPRIIAPAGRFQLVRLGERAIVVDENSGKRFEVTLEDTTAVAFDDYGRLLTTTSDGQLKLTDCKRQTVVAETQATGPVKSIDWIPGAGFAVVSNGRTVTILDNHLQTRRSRTFAERIDSVRSSSDGASIVITTLDVDEIISSDNEDAVGSVMILDANLVTTDLCEITTPAQLARFSRHSNDVLAYEQSGRITTLSPGPLTPVETKWLSPEAIQELIFSSQADDSRYIPESF